MKKILILAICFYQTTIFSNNSLVEYFEKSLKSDSSQVEIDKLIKAAVRSNNFKKFKVIKENEEYRIKSIIEKSLELKIPKNSIDPFTHSLLSELKILSSNDDSLRNTKKEIRSILKNSGYSAQLKVNTKQRLNNLEIVNVKVSSTFQKILFKAPAPSVRIKKHFFSEFFKHASFKEAFSREKKNFQNSTQYTLHKAYPQNQIAMKSILEKTKEHFRERNYLNLKAFYVFKNQNLELSFQNTQKIFIQIYGMKHFWESKVKKEILKENKESSSEFSPERAQEMILNKYKQNGFVDASVELKTKNNEKAIHYSFHISEGEQYFINKIDLVDLNTNIPENIIQKIVSRWKKNIQGPFGKLYFSQEVVDTSLPTLLDNLKEEGFWNAKIIDHKIYSKRTPQIKNIQILVNSNKRHQIRKVTLKKSPDNSINKALSKLLKSKKIYYSDTKRIQGELLEACTSLSYLKCTIEKTFHKIKNGKKSIDLDLEFTVKTGKKVFFNELIIDGLKKTQEELIQNIQKKHLTQNEELNPEKISDFRASLFETNLFKNIQYKFVNQKVSTEFDTKNIYLNFSEKAPGSIEFGPGFRTDLGLIAFWEFKYNNLFGLNKGVLLRGQLSRQVFQNYEFPEQFHTFVFTNPYFFNFDTQFRFELSYTKDNKHVYNSNTIFSNGSTVIDGYNLEELKAEFRFEKRFHKHLRLFWTPYSYSQPRIFDIAGTSTTPQSYDIALTKILLSLDYRDNIFTPKKGFHANLESEYSSPELGSSEEANYFMSSLDLKQYIPMPRNSVLALNLAYSRLWVLGNTSQPFPLNKRLQLGGRDSLRFLTPNSLNNNDPNALDQDSWQLRSEYRMNILDSWGLAFFFEGGHLNTIRSSGALSVPASLGFKYGAGIGLRYLTPVGPLSVDLAKNLNPLANENDYRIELSIGSF